MNQLKNLFEPEGNKFSSVEFKKFFLLEFTRQLILNSAPVEILKLNEILKEEPLHERKEIFKEDIKEHVKEFIEEEEQYEKSNMPKEVLTEKNWARPTIKRKSFPFESFKNVRLTIPEANLPERLRYLMPTPTEHDIDLNELNPLVKDPFVRTIECPGPDTNIIVSGTMGEKKTKISLSSEEINNTIKKFSEAAKIPPQEGIFKVAVGRMIFMAIISDVIGSKFIIKKMISPRLAPPPQGRF